MRNPTNSGVSERACCPFSVGQIRPDRWRQDCCHLQKADRRVAVGFLIPCSVGKTNGAGRRIDRPFDAVLSSLEDASESGMLEILKRPKKTYKLLMRLPWFLSEIIRLQGIFRYLCGDREDFGQNRYTLDYTQNT
jgi:hypothetical protein